MKINCLQWDLNLSQACQVILETSVDTVDDRFIGQALSSGAIILIIDYLSISFASRTPEKLEINLTILVIRRPISMSSVKKSAKMFFKSSPVETFQAFTLCYFFKRVVYTIIFVDRSWNLHENVFVGALQSK